VCSAGVALYEYAGEPPTSFPPHGNKRNADGEYIRTNPKVIEQIRSGLIKERRKPHDVYVQMTAGDSFSMPRDHKQVRNVSQKITEQKVGKMNEADELQHIVGRIHEHKFIKEVCVRKGRSPIITGFTDE